MADQIPAHPNNSVLRAPPRGLDDLGSLVSGLTGIGVKHYSSDGTNVTSVFTFTAFPITIPDATAYVGTKIYDFPRGWIHIQSACSYLTFTTTSAIAGTLNSGVTVSYGFGTVTASNVTLATTMINVLAGTGLTVPTFTSSTTINVASAAVTHATLGNPLPLNGSATALDLYFNIAVPTATDIDADATITCTGTLVVKWTNIGGWDFAASAA